jgi:hypothetical protein
MYENTRRGNYQETSVSISEVPDLGLNKQFSSIFSKRKRQI